MFWELGIGLWTRNKRFVSAGLGVLCARGFGACYSWIGNKAWWCTLFYVLLLYHILHWLRMLILKFRIVNFTLSTFVYTFIHFSMFIWTVLRSNKSPRLLLPSWAFNWPYSWNNLIACWYRNKRNLIIGLVKYLSSWFFRKILIVRSFRMDYFIVDSKLYLLYLIEGFCGLYFDSKLGWFFKLANFGWFSFIFICVFLLLLQKCIQTF